MNKKVLAVLVATLALLSAVGCSSSDADEETGSGSESQTTYNNGLFDPSAGTTDDTASPATPIVTPGATSTSGITNPGYNTPEEDETLEQDPVFTECSLTLRVIARKAAIRSNTVIASSTYAAYAVEGDTLKAIGESKMWYKIQYGEKTYYISKNVVCDADLYAGFTDVNETVEISANVYVRSMPQAAKDTYSLRGTLTKGTKVTRTGVSSTGWSRIKYTIVDEKTGENIEKEYYISSDCIAEASTQP